MEITCCSGCQAPLPESALASGMAVRVGDRILCSKCATAQSTGEPSNNNAATIKGNAKPDARDLVGKKLGRYVVKHLLGQGGMGAVYRGEDPMIGRTVALKVISAPDAGHEFVQRFWQEVRLMARLKHPNIVSLHDAGEQDGFYYMAIEYVEGRGLDKFSPAGDRPPVLVMLKVMSAIAGALQHGHEQQIIHKDLKPANIMISPTGVPMLMDYGLAAPASGDPLLQPGVCAGTPGYMSPEQAYGSSIGVPSDIWSLGATLFSILAGRTVYVGATIMDIVRKTGSPDLVDLTPLEGKAPEFVIAIIAKCLRKKAEERYHSAAELKRALEAAIDHLESAEGGETMVMALPRSGQTLLLHVEYQEAGLPGSYREYEIDSHIGGGAFGEVYRAKEKLSGRIAALKVLKHEWLADKAAVARFRREATLLSRLSAPNVLRVHNFGRYGSTFFMDMDLLDGPTLESIRRERGVLPPNEAVGYAVGILQGLDAIHQAGMVHRDLKPANVAVIQGRTVIFDLGLAHSADLTRLTMSGQFLGTPHYASPEQAAGIPTTGASDVYAAGVMLYEMLTGKTPHEADSVFGVLRKKAAEPPTPITSHGREFPASIVSFMDRVLATNPEERPAAAEAARMLAAVRV